MNTVARLQNREDSCEYLALRDGLNLARAVVTGNGNAEMWAEQAILDHAEALELSATVDDLIARATS